MNKLNPTTCIKNSEFSGGSGIVAHILPRQICDLTTFKGCKFGYFDNRAEFAMFFATFHTQVRWQILTEWIEINN